MSKQEIWHISPTDTFSNKNNYNALCGKPILRVVGGVHTCKNNFITTTGKPDEVKLNEIKLDICEKCKNTFEEVANGKAS
jgi:hypothetical protein